MIPSWFSQIFAKSFFCSIYIKEEFLPFVLVFVYSDLRAYTVHTYSDWVGMQMKTKVHACFAFNKINVFHAGLRLRTVVEWNYYKSSTRYSGNFPLLDRIILEIPWKCFMQMTSTKVPSEYFISTNAQFPHIIAHCLHCYLQQPFTHSLNGLVWYSTKR
jgi:hypothetical protein